MRLRTALWLQPILALVLLCVIWEVSVDAFDVAPYLVPAPSAVWRAFVEMQDSLPPNIVTTFLEAVLGLAVGGFAGAALALSLSTVGFLRRGLYPLLVASQTVPIVVLAPLFVLWFGLGLAPKVAVVGLITFFPVTLAVLQATLNVDDELRELFCTMSASRLQVVWNVLMPSALPGFFAGMKIAASYAVAGAVIGEWVGASSGLGLLLSRAQHSFRVDRVFVAIVVIALLSMLLFVVVDAASRIAMPWMRPVKGNQ